MDCVPELAVAKRKTVSSTKMAKRLRRFVRENQVYDDDGDANLEEGDGDVATATTLSRELLCRIPEETLFQLQQIYEALEESNGISSNGSGGNGGVGGTRGEGSRRKSTSSLPSLTNLIYGSSGGGVDEMAVEEPVGPGGDADAEGSSRSTEKPTKKRARDGGAEPAAPAAPATVAKVESGQQSSSPKKKKKKSRRKSNAT